jgi:hypothetical protein
MLVFIRILLSATRSGHAYKFLLVKALCDALALAIHSFELLHSCQTCPTYLTRAQAVWFIWFKSYTEHAVELCSGLFQIAATIDCIIILTRKFPYFRYKHHAVFFGATTLIVVYSFGYCIFDLIALQMTTLRRGVANTSFVANTTANFTTGLMNNRTDYFYSYEFTNFSRTFSFDAFKIGYTVQRDVLVELALTGLVIALLVFAVRDHKAWKDKAISSSRMSQTVILSSYTRNAERTTGFMIVAAGFSYLVGHLPTLVSVFLPVDSEAPVWCRCFRPLFEQIVFYLSYATPLVFYVVSSRKFRSFL